MSYLNAFLWVVKSSLIGSVMVALILVIKFLFHKKLNPTILYFIWMILLIKLIIPFGPQSPISLYNIFNSPYKSVNNYVNVKKQVTTQKLVTTEVVNSTNISKAGPKIINKANLESNPKIRNGITFYQIVKKISSYKNAYGLMWLMGIMLLALYTLFGAISIRKKINSAINNSENFIPILEHCEKQMNIKEKVSLVVSDNIAGPLIYGVFRPAILIPNRVCETIPKGQMRYIIMHELCHLKRKDNIVNWIISILKIVYWFNPIILLGLKSMQSECELACDSKVLSYIKNTENFEYGITLINVAKLVNQNLLLPGSTSMVMKKSKLKRRIIMISMNNKKNKKGILLGLIIILVLGMVGLTGRVIKSDAKVKDTNSVKDYSASYSTPEAFLKLYDLKVQGDPHKFKVDVPKTWDVKVGEHPAGLFWQLANEFSKDAGLDLTPLKGTTVDVWRYSLVDGLLSEDDQNGFKYPSTLVLLVNNEKVVGAWLSFNSSDIGPSVKKHYLKDITGLDFKEWTQKKGLFSDLGKNNDLASLGPVDVAKAYLKAIHDGDKTRMDACEAPTYYLKCLTSNVGYDMIEGNGDRLYNIGYNQCSTTCDGIVKLDPISCEFVTDTPKVIVEATMYMTWRIAAFNADGIDGGFGINSRFFVMEKYANGWKIAEWDTGY